jgi:hypothetical protein
MTLLVRVCTGHWAGSRAPAVAGQFKAGWAARRHVAGGRPEPDRVCACWRALHERRAQVGRATPVFGRCQFMPDTRGPTRGAGHAGPDTRGPTLRPDTAKPRLEVGSLAEARRHLVIPVRAWRTAPQWETQALFHGNPPDGHIYPRRHSHFACAQRNSPAQSLRLLRRCKRATDGPGRATNNEEDS